MTMEDRAIQRKRQKILNVKFDLIAYEIVMQTIEQWRQQGKCQYVAITNPHSVLLCYRDEMMFRATHDAGLVLPDGIGIVLAARLLGYNHNGRASGPTLMLKLCDWAREKGYRHFFYGGAEGVADKLADKLSQEYPGLNVAGTYCPPFRRLTDEEKWMAEHVGRINATAMIGVGAAFDFHSGKVKWAPALVRRLGLEWAYRLIQEPRRMWRRNLDSPLFLSRVMRQRLSMDMSRQH